MDAIKPDVLARIREAIKDDEALLILDGLDETPKEGVRGRLREVITRFTETYPECRVLVTSRPYAYEESDEWRLDGAGFEVASLEPLDPPAVEFFVRAWFRQLVARKLATAQEAQHQERRLLEAIGTEAYMEPLVASPLMLTMVSDLASSGESTFRGGRSALYEKSTELLLDRWNEVNRKEGIHKLSEATGMPLDAIRHGLESLACSVHESRGREADPKKQFIAHTEIWDALQEARPKSVKSLDLAELTSYLNERSGILLADEKKRYRFPHRSFQEFLASSWLLADNDYPDTLVQRVEKDAQLWKEVFLFAAEREGETAPRFYTLLDALIPDGPEEPPDIERMRLAILTGDALVRTGRYTGALGRHASKLERVRKWLTLALTEDSLDVPTRAEAGRYLGTIGDKRPGVGLRPDGVPDIDWVTIPAGKLLMGDDSQEMDVPAFRISRYPITNAQYQAFIDGGVYADGEAPHDWGAVFTTPNHPRVGVTWYEAQAFCRWLSEKLEAPVELPSESQWEKAARGVEGRLYPWGNTYDPTKANGADADVGSTTAVGLFSSGASPYGVLDMSGNVLEWCADGDEGSRALRGGSFY